MEAAINTFLSADITTVKPLCKCSMCGLPFPSQGPLRQHIREQHEAEKPFKCSECDTTFTRSHSMRKHMAKLHDIQIAPTPSKAPVKNVTVQNKCRHCGQEFVWGDELRKHLAQHHDEGDFECHKCGEIFTNNDELKNHEKIHEQFLSKFSKTGVIYMDRRCGEMAVPATTSYHNLAVYAPPTDEELQGHTYDPGTDMHCQELDNNNEAAHIKTEAEEKTSIVSLVDMSGTSHASLNTQTLMQVQTPCGLQYMLAPSPSMAAMPRVLGTATAAQVVGSLTSSPQIIMAGSNPMVIPPPQLVLTGSRAPTPLLAANSAPILTTSASPLTSIPQLFPSTPAVSSDQLMASLANLGTRIAPATSMPANLTASSIFIPASMGGGVLNSSTIMSVLNAPPLNTTATLTPTSCNPITVSFSLPNRAPINITPLLVNSDVSSSSNMSLTYQDSPGVTLGEYGETNRSPGRWPTARRSKPPEPSEPCPVCGKVFKWAYDIKRHILAHAGDKPFKCSICDTSYTRQSALTAHNVSEHGEKRYECQECKNCYVSKVDLQRHVCSSS